MSGVRCPKCGGTASIGRLGNAVTLFWRKLLRRNLYVCHRCALVWRSPACDGSVRTNSPNGIRIHR